MIGYPKWLKLIRLMDALAALPKHTLWCVGSMEDGPFARLVLPQPDGGYGGGYVEAYGDTPSEAVRAALAIADRNGNRQDGETRLGPKDEHLSHQRGVYDDRIWSYSRHS
jgi:hypothetical protein